MRPSVLLAGWSLAVGEPGRCGEHGGIWPWVLALLFLPGWVPALRGAACSPEDCLLAACPRCRGWPVAKAPPAPHPTSHYPDLRAGLASTHLASGPGSLLGAPAASSCPRRDSSFPEELSAKGTQGAWDTDIPAINRGLIPEETPESSFLLEGDIIRPSPFRLLSAASSRWPKSGGLVEVPFLLSSKYDELSRGVILAAFAEFEHSTCVRFVPYEGQRDFISIVPMSGCFSGVGRSGGLQVLSLAPACLRRGPGIALHELMHVLGFWHEHARADRDRYIRVDWREILPGFEINFIKSRSSNMLAPYDYASVLHYGRLAFSRRGAPTIVPLRDPRAHLGQRRNLSASDVTRVLRLYACGPRREGPRAIPLPPGCTCRDC